MSNRRTSQMTASGRIDHDCDIATEVASGCVGRKEVKEGRTGLVKR